jgi:hypothetical protein
VAVVGAVAGAVAGVVDGAGAGAVPFVAAGGKMVNAGVAGSALLRTLARSAQVIPKSASSPAHCGAFCCQHTFLE